MSFLHNHEANAAILGGARSAPQLLDVFSADLERDVHERSSWQRAKELRSYFIRYRL